MEVDVGHVGELLHATVDEEALEAGHSGLDHGPKLQLHEEPSVVLTQRSVDTDVSVWHRAASLYLIARNDASPEGRVHETPSRGLPLLFVEVAERGGGGDAISVEVFNNKIEQ